MRLRDIMSEAVESIPPDASVEDARELMRRHDVRHLVVVDADFVLALADVQRFSNESIHEKLHELAAHIGVKKFPAERPAPPGTSRGQ